MLAALVALGVTFSDPSDESADPPRGRERSSADRTETAAHPRPTSDADGGGARLDEEPVAATEAATPATKVARTRSAETRGRELERQGEGESDADARYVDPVSPAGQRARGIYVSGPYARSRGAEGLIETVRFAKLNAVVIDLKDSAGRVTYDSSIELLRDQERPFLGDAKAFVRTLKEAGVYTIARVVCFSDPVLPKAHPERAIQHFRRGDAWVSWGTGGTWLDPYNRDNHDLVVSLAKEAQTLGFDEVQLDYIRFPVDDGTKYAAYPSQDDRPRWQVLLGLLRRIDAALSIPLGVDTFGLTAFDGKGNGELGQNLEPWMAHVEVVSPMLYLNAMGHWGRGLANREEALIRQGVSELRGRIGPVAVIRPFLQAFPQGVERFDAHFIADQVRGARRGGADGMLFWHPRSSYQTLGRGMRGPARPLLRFPIDERQEARRVAWTGSD